MGTLLVQVGALVRSNGFLQIQEDGSKISACNEKTLIEQILSLLWTFCRIHYWHIIGIYNGGDKDSTLKMCDSLVGGGQRWKNMETLETLSVLIISSCANFLDFHTIFCTIL